MDNTVVLSKIYNSLTLISTRGEDTLIMADCLRALYSYINEQNTYTETKVINLEDKKE